MLDANRVIIEKEKKNQSRIHDCLVYLIGHLLSSEWSLSWRWSSWHHTRHFNEAWASTCSGTVLVKAFPFWPYLPLFHSHAVLLLSSRGCTSRSCSGSKISFRVDVYSFHWGQCHGCVNNRNFTNTAEFVQLSSTKPCLSLTPCSRATLPWTQRHSRAALLLKRLLKIASSWEGSVWRNKLESTCGFLLVRALYWECNMVNFWMV